MLLDGGMGTMLQKHGVGPGTVPEVLSIEQPELITAIHREYVEAGADIIYTNTFGVNKFKMEGTGYTAGQAADAAVKAAKAACGENTLVAIDLGPTGKLLEPMGTLSFEDAYSCFAEVAAQGEKSGADLAVIETMTDLYEVKAAVLAVKEKTSLPVIVSMTFGEDGRTFTGCGIEEMTALLEGLHADAIGINCSLGPDEIFPLAEKLCAETVLPVFIKPNAGLPDPQTGEYAINAEEFSAAMEKYIDLGVSMIGGCCGTSPEYTKNMKAMLAGKSPVKRTAPEPKTIVCSATRSVTFDRTVIIGERMNPTGKPRLKEAILNGDYGYVMKLAVLQAEQGADILDVNAGIPGIDEAKVLPELIRKIQSVTDVPLQIDSGNPEAIEAALRIYNGKAIVNSVNGTEKSLAAILPIVRHYGAAAVALTLDDSGIPPTAEGRFTVAEKIVERAGKAGIKPCDLIADCLTLTVSAEQKAAGETLRAVRLVKEKLGLRTVLGVSNISFGLPNRPLVNRTFLTMALANGLDSAIMDPGDEGMKGAVLAYELLAAKDKNAEDYIKAYQDTAAEEKKESSAGSSAADDTGTFEGVFGSLKRGLGAETEANVNALLETNDEITVINEYLVPALDRIGKAFEAGTLYLPQMMQAAVAAQAGFEVIKKRLAGSGKERVSKGDIVVATVKGDIHDIGKNIVRTIMENYGYNVIDMGRDVDPAVIVEAVRERNVKLVGLSALMTTTLGSMKETIDAVKATDPECRVMVGGAVLTEEYAHEIGADYYCADAMRSVEAANQVFGA